MTWEELDWAALDRLRTRFLSESAAQGPYWKTRADLASYDFTYGARIGWKWDAVLDELDQRGWRPAPPEPSKVGESSGHVAGRAGIQVLDWGCGTGVAGRRVVHWLGIDRVAVLRVWDYSPLAAGFAAEAAGDRFPNLRVEQVTPGFIAGDESVGVLVISHVLNELPAAELQALRRLAGRAEAILWVEPGTSETSRALIDVREQLRGRFRLIAPCTHQDACGLLTPENSRHWCHHFAPPPSGIFADSLWVKFGQRAGIDLRSLPYSFLVMESAATSAATEPGWARVIGAPRLYKGFAKVLSCEAGGVRELTAQKRDAPGLFKRLKRPEGAHVYRWQRAGERIQAADVSWPRPAEPRA